MHELVRVIPFKTLHIPKRPVDTNRGLYICYQNIWQEDPAMRPAAQADTLADKRIVVAIDSWDVDSAYPSGHYVRTLGPIGDKDTETEVLLLENDINTSPFSPAVHACVPPLPWSVTPADLNDPNRCCSSRFCLCIGRL